jgi:release factor glutamine methyltransferase
MAAADSIASLAALPSCERTDELLAAAARALDVARVGDSPRLDAALLLSRATGRPRTLFFAAPERPVAPEERRRFAELIARRLRGEPVAYLVGEREFFSLSLRVSPAVLVPRPETELLVEAALQRCARLDAPAVLDVGTGSGAVALAIAQQCRGACVTASDVSEAALSQARENERLVFAAAAIRWVASNWFDALHGERFDLIVSNPPYVRTAEIAGPLAFEPRIALDGGADGLDAYRVLLAAAQRHLRAGGALLVEHGAAQRASLVELAAAHGWRVAAARDDVAGRARVLELERSDPT